MNSTLQIRVNKDTKTKAQKVFKELGIDMSSGVKLFLSQVINTRSIPFVPRTENGFTEAREIEMVKETKKALKSGKSYKTADELFRSVLADEDC